MPLAWDLFHEAIHEYPEKQIKEVRTPVARVEMRKLTCVNKYLHIHQISDTRVMKDKYPLQDYNI